MTTFASKTTSLYTKLFTHCQKQYKNIAAIHKAYIINGQVYAIDYVNTNGINCISSNTAIAEKIISFK
jgi:hypothetical protein